MELACRTRYHSGSIHPTHDETMKTTMTLCALAAAGILVSACATQANTDNGGEAMQQVYQTGSNIPHHSPAGTGVATMNRDDAGRVFTDPTMTPPLPPPAGGAR